MILHPVCGVLLMVPTLAPGWAFSVVRIGGIKVEYLQLALLYWVVCRLKILDKVS